MDARALRRPRVDLDHDTPNARDRKVPGVSAFLTQFNLAVLSDTWECGLTDTMGKRVADMTPAEREREREYQRKYRAANQERFRERERERGRKRREAKKNEITPAMWAAIESKLKTRKTKGKKK